jgi:hypothetical protein
MNWAQLGCKSKNCKTKKKMFVKNLPTFWNIEFFGARRKKTLKDLVLDFT